MTTSNQSLNLDQYNNPYYLHNSDHAGLALVSDRLETGADFHSWRRSVRMALNVRNKLGFIDGPTPASSTGDTSFYNGQDTTDFAFAIQNGYRPRAPRPVCTYCGQSGHVIQKCFKKYGYPPGYIPGYKSTPGYYQSQRPFSQQNSPTQQMSSPVQQPAGQFQAPRPHTIANVMSGPFPYIPSPASTSMNLNVNQMNPDQIQSLIQQLSAHVQVSESPVPSPQSLTQSSSSSNSSNVQINPPVSTVTEHGAMAAQSTSGDISFPSSSLRFENQKLTFQHQCLSSLYSNLPHGSWIIDSGATSHVCSDLSLFSETISVSGEFIQGLTIGRGTLMHNLYILQLDIPTSHHSIQSIQSSFSGSLKVDGDLWHKRLGHPSADKLLQLSGTLPTEHNSVPDDIFDKVIMPLPIPVEIDTLETVYGGPASASHSSHTSHTRHSHSSVLPIVNETIPAETAVVSLPKERPKRNAKFHQTIHYSLSFIICPFLFPA
ncbi:unnamed protein product [Arabidopsis halleri]